MEETTENYRSEQPAARILLQTANEFNLALQLVWKILPQSGLESRTSRSEGTAVTSLALYYVYLSAKRLGTAGISLCGARVGAGDGD